MKFAISATTLSLAGFAVAASVLPRQSCPQASRFGNLFVSSPSGAASYNPGDPINIRVDLTCAINNFGIVPKSLDYTIQVPTGNNGHEQPIVLAHHSLAAGTTSDTFTTTIPHTLYFAGAAYNVVLTDTYPINGTDGSQVLVRGGVQVPITINA